MTNGYGSFDVKQLWQMVDTAHQQLAPSHEQITAWERTHQMLDQHHQNLQRLRGQLEAQWPADQNPAAAAYLGHLDNLLSAVDLTAKASDVNSRQLGFVVDQIQKTHAALKPLHDEYVQNEGKIADYNSKVNAVATGASALSGPVGGPAAGAVTKFGVELFTSAPVPDGRQDKINEQARRAMAPLTGAAQDAEWNMIVPPEYEPPQVGERRVGSHLDPEDSNGATAPPQIDPPAHTRFEPGAHGVLVPIGTGDSDIPGHGATAGGGPVLSGSVISAPPPVAPQPAPIVSQPPTHGGLPTTIGPIAPMSGVFPLPSSGPGIKSGTGSFGKPFGGGGVKAMPPGGVIGGAPGQGIVNGASAGPRANPVGGVIGQGSKATMGQPNGSAVAAGQRTGKKRDEREGRRWDPDNPWAVDHGVTPVIHPNEEPKSFDAGPGVIGIDR